MRHRITCWALGLVCQRRAIAVQGHCNASAGHVVLMSCCLSEQGCFRVLCAAERYRFYAIRAAAPVGDPAT